MKNIQGTEEDLELFNENGNKVYEYYKSSNGCSWECTYDSNGNELTYKDSKGFSKEMKQETYTTNNMEKEKWHIVYYVNDGLYSRGITLEGTLEECIATFKKDYGHTIEIIYRPKY